jgi:hypothetical protein
VRSRKSRECVSGTPALAGVPRVCGPSRREAEGMQRLRPVQTCAAARSWRSATVRRGKIACMLAGRSFPGCAGGPLP